MAELSSILFPIGVVLVALAFAAHVGHAVMLANGRRVAHVGVAVRGFVTSFGLVVNATPDLAPFRDVRCDGDPLPMTSLARESGHRVRVTTVRQLLLELIVKRFGFDRVSIFHTHPAALPRPTRHAISHGS